MRAELRLLGSLRAPAHYQLRLAGRVNEGLARPSPWLRSAVLGATVAVAVAILLWPQLDPTRPRPAAAGPLPTIWAQHARAWAGPTAARGDIGSVATGHAAARRPARYSQAQLRFASF